MGLDRVLTRRQLLQSIPALAVAPLASRAFAQGAPGAIRVTGINHVTLSVSDVTRSVECQQVTKAEIKVLIAWRAADRNQYGRR